METVKQQEVKPAAVVLPTRKQCSGISPSASYLPDRDASWFLSYAKSTTKPPRQIGRNAVIRHNRVKNTNLRPTDLYVAGIGASNAAYGRAGGRNDLNVEAFNKVAAAYPHLSPATSSACPELARALRQL